MINHTDKTIPYRLSPAELENLRILRRKTKPSGVLQDDEEEEEMSEEIKTRDSDPDPLHQKPEKKIP